MLQAGVSHLQGRSSIEKETGGEFWSRLSGTPDENGTGSASSSGHVGETGSWDDARRHVSIFLWTGTGRRSYTRQHHVSGRRRARGSRLVPPVAPVSGGGPMPRMGCRSVRAFGRSRRPAGGSSTKSGRAMRRRGAWPAGRLRSAPSPRTAAPTGSFRRHSRSMPGRPARSRGSGSSATRNRRPSDRDTGTRSEPLRAPAGERRRGIRAAAGILSAAVYGAGVRRGW